MHPKIAAYFAAHLHASPVLVVDLAHVRAHYDALATHMPYATCFYAVKANPAPEVVRVLAEAGSCFDTASIYEIEACAALGIDPSRMLFGNTLKKPADIARAYGLGVRVFTVDTQDELHKVAAHAPGSSVFCRLKTSEFGAAWPLSKKFGASCQQAIDILLRAPALGLIPYGVSFHVGSQQTHIPAWEDGIRDAASVFSALAERGVLLRALDLGGGIPGQYRDPVPDISEYGTRIHGYLKAWILDRFPDTQFLMEPGRYLTADAGVLQAEVVAIDAGREEHRRWVYLDVGKFNGLMEAESIEYHIATDRDEDPMGAVVIAGPTCDSIDVVYEHAPYVLPLTLRVGDRVRFIHAGAYTTTYASVGFNGFPPLQAVYLPQ